jgi:PAS domain S-box-containing protein
VREQRGVVQIGDPDHTAREDDRLALGRPVGWGAPIEIAGRFWGALIVAGDKRAPVPPDVAERLSRFADLAGVAIANLQARSDLLDQLVQTERFAALVELSDDFIAIADLDGRTAYLNAGGRRLVGLADLDEAREQHTRDYLTEDGRRYLREVSGPAVRERGSFRGETTLQHFVTGEPIPVSVNAYMIGHPLSGEPLAVAIVQHDLRERKRAEVELRERAEEVEQLATARRFLLVEALRAEDRMRRQIADALHDNVLQELYAVRLDLGRVDEDAEALHRGRIGVDAATRQLRDAVSDLHPAVASAHDLESRLRSILEQGGNRAGFGYRLECDASAPGPLDDLLIALLRELVHNVVKHAAATFVVARVTGDDTHVVLEVSDDGRGIPPGRPEEALRRGHVGLASARERVEAIDGRLEIDSGPRAGTRIRAFLPREPQRR